jgi:hypothetical protein
MDKITKVIQSVAANLPPIATNSATLTTLRLLLPLPHDRSPLLPKALEAFTALLDNPHLATVAIDCSLCRWHIMV